MKRAGLLLALLASSSAAFAQEQRPLSLEHRMLLRCSAAFALVANRQASGEADALAYPAMAARGRAFFVTASARVMDEAGLDRAAIAAALEAEAGALLMGETLGEVMPVCLSLLPPE